MIAESVRLALFVAGLLAGLWLLDQASDARVAEESGPPPDRRWPRPRRLRARRAGGLTPGVVLAGVFVYAAALAVLLDRRFVALLALSLLPLSYAFWRRRRERRLLEHGDVVEADLLDSRRLVGRRGYAGRSLTVSFEHGGRSVSSELYAARHDPRDGKRVTLLVDPADSSDVLVYEDSSFRIEPPR